MKLKKRFNLASGLFIGVSVVLMVLLYLVANSIFRELSAYYDESLLRLSAVIYVMIAVFIILAVGAVIIFRILVNRMLKQIGEIDDFTETLVHGNYNASLDMRGSDELKHIAVNLNNIAESYKEKVFVLESAMAKRQKVVRELAILNELMVFISSEFRFDVILKNFADRTRDLIKSDYCIAMIFEMESINTKIFITNEGIQDPSEVSLTPDGFFKELLKNQVPLRLSSKQKNVTGALQEDIKIPELNLEVKDVLVVPLISSDKLSGLLLLADKEEGTFEQEDEDMLMNFSFQAFQTIAMHEEIANLAITDGLTDLNNHRHFQEKLKETAEMAKRYRIFLSLLILDVDNFKTFNDIYGHQVGDMVLKSVSATIKGHIRATDFPARYGGEEFAVIMPETSYDGAKILAERLRKRIAETPFLLSDGEKALITVSIGFASIPENARDKDELMEMADKALYFAKQHGRNLSYGFNETHKKLEEMDGDFKTGELEIENLANVIDSRTPYTKGHSVEVAKLATLLAGEIGLEKSDIESLRIASILHDVGTLHIPERVLNKPGDLTEEEKKIIQAHPGLVEMVLKKYPHVEQVLPAILYHHERFDGNGYPTGILGDEIPLHARILAIAEAFNAMISPRPYKKRLAFREAVNELQAQSGSQFDPQLVESFMKMLETREYS